MRYEHHLARAARRWAERPAVTCGTEQVTFGQLDARATGLAARLAGLGVRPGDRVADLRENSIESVVTDFGCAAAGAPRVSLNPRLADAEIAHLLRDSGPAVLLVDPVQGVRAHRAGFTDLVQHVVTDLACDERPAAGYPGAAGGAGPGDILAIRYTGGTTGRPKGAIRTHAHQQWVATNVLLDLCDLGEDDVLLHTQPLSHGAHVFVLPCVMRGARQVVLPRFDPNAVLATIAAERVTVLKLVPTMLHRLLDAMAGTTADLGSLRQ
jgi:fatty-acyl-CoA synthase